MRMTCIRSSRHGSAFAAGGAAGRVLNPGRADAARRLNVGCGADIREGWVNLDCTSLPGVDVCHDLSDLPLPFDDGAFDEILCQHVLEHLEYIPVLRELHRILRPGGTLWIEVPHFTSKYAYADPTHRKVFTAETFAYFVTGHRRSYYFTFHFSAMHDLRIGFERRPMYFWNYFIEMGVNLNARAQNYYESSALRVFPAKIITVRLVK